MNDIFQIQLDVAGNSLNMEQGPMDPLHNNQKDIHH